MHISMQYQLMRKKNKEAMTLKESCEVYMGKFRGKKKGRENCNLKYPLKNKQYKIVRLH